MEKSSLGDRMKAYEGVSQTSLTPRMPLIIRLDGKAFHSYTRGFDKPFDIRIRNAMADSAFVIISEVQGAKIAYSQSDEVSVLVTDYDSLEFEPWFGKNLQKIVSVSSSIMTAYFNNSVPTSTLDKGRFATFDSRAFVLPKEEVCNYFIWREQDATRNSIQALAQANFSHKSLQGLNNNQLQEKLFQEKGINWNDLETWKKRGFCVTRDGTDYEIPIFTQDRSYIENYVNVGDA